LEWLQLDVFLCGWAALAGVASLCLVSADAIFLHCLLLKALTRRKAREFAIKVLEVLELPQSFVESLKFGHELLQKHSFSSDLCRESRLDFGGSITSSYWVFWRQARSFVGWH
jgi:hypothetical protein